MKLSRTLLALVCTILATSASAQTIESDPIISAMREELDYNMQELKQKPVPVYFMSLRMNDTYSATVVSEFGVSTSYESRSRTITPHVRVGSPEMDNFKYENQMRSNGTVSVPFKGNEIMGVRQAIWRETMSRYDAAVNGYNSALSQKLTNADNEDKAPCFSDAPVEKYYEQQLPESAYSIDSKTWQERLDRVSALFKQCRYLEEGSASLSYEIERVIVVTTDGSTVAQNRKAVRLMLNASIRATDGMVCPLYKDWFAYSIDDMPDEETIAAATKDLITRLEALRDAPIADPYAGPAIMDGAASGVFFHEIFGHRLEAHRMKSGGQTFKKLVGELVLPSDFQVYDDPTLNSYAGKALNGYYLYDDEAVKAQRVQCVEDGVLRNFLVDRTPIDGFPASNGHGRAYQGYDPVSRQSNLVIETRHPYSADELRQMLVDAVRKEGKEYGYYFRTATSGMTYTGEGGSINSFGVDPVEVYRVFADGRPDQLVRGVTLIGTPLAMFSGIAAGGATPEIFTGQCGAESGWVPVTAISPMIYVTKIETQRSETGYQLPQVLEAPEQKDVTGDDATVIFQAMQDEMARTMTGLHAEGEELPYYTDYRVNVVKSFAATSTLGGISTSDYMPKIVTLSANIQIGDSMTTNSQRSYSMSQIGNEVDYDAIRRSLWQQGDFMYKNAINDYSQKVSALKISPKPENEACLPELLRLPGGEYIQESTQNNSIDRTGIEKLANTLSSVYLDYPKLYNTSVTIQLEYTDIYRLNSDGLKLRWPQTIMSLSTIVSVRTNEGAEINESYEIPFDCNDYDEELLKSQIREFADAIIAKSEAETVNEFYIGPILLERQAVAYSFNTIVSNYGSASTTWDMYSSLYRYSRGNTDRPTSGLLLGKRFLDQKLGIHLYSDMESYNGVKLGGSYKIDYDGIKPERDFVLVENGILRNLMSGRTPGIGTSRPTGHSMAPGNIYMTQPSVGMRIMHVTCEKPVALSKMKSQLISEAKKAGLDHTYMLSNISYNCYILTRIDVKTGQETIIHSNTPNFERRELMHVISASKEESIQSYPNNPANFQTMIAPEGMLLESIEMNLTKPGKAPEFHLVNPSLR